MAETKISAK